VIDVLEVGQTLHGICSGSHSTLSYLLYLWYIKKIKLNSMALVRELTIPTERPPLVGEVSANFCG
jgi:hypothetical protein